MIGFMIILFAHSEFRFTPGKTRFRPSELKPKVKHAWSRSSSGGFRAQRSHLRNFFDDEMKDYFTQAGGKICRFNCQTKACRTVNSS